MPTKNPALDWFEAKMIQLWLGFRTRRCLIEFWFASIEEVRDFINEHWLEALRLAKAGFGRIVCEDLAKIPYLIQTHEEAKRMIALVESLQKEVEAQDFLLDELKKTHQEEIDTIKQTEGYQKIFR